MYIGITGTIGSGKGEVVRVLRRYGFVHYSFGETLRNEAKLRGIPVTMANIQALANELRAEYGADYLAKKLLGACEHDAPKHAVFESILSSAELRTLKRLNGLILISVDAPRELRFGRQQARGRPDMAQTFEEFSAFEDGQLEGDEATQQRLVVMEQADVKLVNIGNLEELESQVRDSLDL